MCEDRAHSGSLALGARDPDWPFNTFLPDSRASMCYVSKNDVMLNFFRYNLVYASYLAVDVSLGYLLDF